MYQNEILMESLRQSIIILDAKLTIFFLINNITITKPTLDEAHVTYFVSSYG